MKKQGCRLSPPSFVIRSR